MKKDNLEVIIKSARHTYVIKDPDHSFFNTLSPVEQDFMSKRDKPEEISIQRAYREGIKFAFDHMESYILKRIREIE